MMDSFIPSKKGRPWDQKTISKKNLTLYLSESTLKSVEKFAARFDLCKSSIIELALRISNLEVIRSIPLFNGLKFYDSDMELLKNIMKKTGAKTISEILHVCQYSWIIKEIRKEIENMHKA